MPTMEERLLKYFKGFRKQHKSLVFLGVKYANDGLKDPKGYPFTDITKGRLSLVQRVTDIFKKDELEKLIRDYRVQAKTSAQQWLDVLSKKVIEHISEKKKGASYSDLSEQDKVFFDFFDDHYGPSIHKLIRWLLVIKHKDAKTQIRIGKPSTVIWMDRSVKLTDKQVQLEIYRHILETMPDPMALRLALAKQYWWMYLRANLMEMIGTIKRNYNKFSGKFLRYTNFPTIDLSDVNVVDGAPKFINAILSYTRDMYSDGIYIRIPKEFAMFDGYTLNEEMLKGERMFQICKLLAEKNEIIRALRIGIMANPWEHLAKLWCASTKAEISLIRSQMRYASDWPSMKEKFLLDEIWEPKCQKRKTKKQKT